VCEKDCWMTVNVMLTGGGNSEDEKGINLAVMAGGV